MIFVQYAPSVIAVGDASSPIGGAFVAVTSSAVPSGEGGTPQGVTEGALQQQLNYAMIEFGDEYGTKEEHRKADKTSARTAKKRDKTREPFMVRLFANLPG